jgi:hypothetical protein
MKKFLISLAIPTCFIFESKAVKISLPPADEIEATSTQIKHKGSSLSIPISKDFLTEDPGIQGPYGIAVECNQALVEYSAFFKKSPEGRVLDKPQRISFWLAQSVNNPERWRVVTPSGARSFTAGDYEERIQPNNFSSYYFDFQDLED